jgi:hypothetical protein
VLTNMPVLIDYCQEIGCNVSASIAGPDMRLACPDVNDVRSR